MTKNKSKKTAPKSDYCRTSIGNSTTPKVTKDTVSFIEKPAEKDSKRKKKKESKKTEDGIVRRLAKNGLIDKDKVKAARKSSSKHKKKKKTSPSASYSDSSSSSTRAGPSIDSGGSSSDGNKKKSRKKKSRTDDNDNKPSSKAKSKAKKENKIQKLTQSMEDAQQGMLAMATELRELRGLPMAMQKQFEEQQEKRGEGER